MSYQMLVSFSGLDNKCTIYPLSQEETDISSKKKPVATHTSYLSCCTFTSSDQQVNNISYALSTAPCCALFQSLDEKNSCVLKYMSVLLIISNSHILDPILLYLLAYIWGALVLVNLLNKLRKRDRMQGFAQHFIIFPKECNKFKNTED